MTVPDTINTAWIPAGRSGFGSGVLLNELWLLYPGTINSPYADVANGKKSIYASAYQCRNQAGIDKFKKVIKDRKNPYSVIAFMICVTFFGSGIMNVVWNTGQLMLFLLFFTQYPFKKDENYIEML